MSDAVDPSLEELIAKEADITARCAEAAQRLRNAQVEVGKLEQDKLDAAQAVRDRFVGMRRNAGCVVKSDD